MDRPEIILAPGPTPIPPEVLLAQGSPLVYHRGPGFGKLMRDVTARLKELYRTETADVLRTSRAAVYALSERGQLPGVIRIGRRLLVDSAALVDWLHQKRASSPKGLER